MTALDALPLRLAGDHDDIGRLQPFRAQPVECPRLQHLPVGAIVVAAQPQQRALTLTRDDIILVEVERDHRCGPPFGPERQDRHEIGARDVHQVVASPADRLPEIGKDGGERPAVKEGRP